MTKDKFMSTNKKLLLSTISLSFAVVMMIAALLFVLNISPNNSPYFAISYAADEKAAVKITSFYQYEGEENITKFGEVTFYGDDSSDGSLDRLELSLTPQRSAVRLIYIFENSSDDVIKITPMWTDLQDNLDSVSEEETTNNKNILVNCQHLNNLEDLPSEFLRDKSISLATAAGQRSCYLDSENKLQVIVVTIAVANVNRNAYCHSDNDGGLSFSIVTLPQEEQ